MDTNTTNSSATPAQGDNINEDLANAYKATMKPVAIETLSGKPEITMAQLARLLEHDEYGTVIATITLQDLVTAAIAKNSDALESLLTEDPPAGTKKVVAPPSRTTKPTKKKSAKKTTKKTSKRGSLDRDAGYPAITKAVKKAGPCAISDVVSETGISENHVRTMLKELMEQEQIVATGSGRGRKYEVAG